MEINKKKGDKNMTAIENKNLKINRSKIMKDAHMIFSHPKMFKLYQFTEGVQTFADCLKYCWRCEKERVKKEIERINFESKYNEWAKTHVICETVNLDDVPKSVLYPKNNRGYLGSKYVGD